jgi:hypothetical protein
MEVFGRSVHSSGRGTHHADRKNMDVFSLLLCIDDGKVKTTARLSGSVQGMSAIDIQIALLFTMSAN